MKYKVHCGPLKTVELFMWERSPHILISELEFSANLWPLMTKSSGSVQQGREVNTLWLILYSIVSTWIPQDLKQVWIYRKCNIYIVASTWAPESGPQDDKDVLHMWMLWGNIYSVFRFDHSHEHAYWEETMFLWTVWEIILYVFKLE